MLKRHYISQNIAWCGKKRGSRFVLFFLFLLIWIKLKIFTLIKIRWTRISSQQQSYRQSMLWHKFQAYRANIVTISTSCLYFFLQSSTFFVWFIFTFVERWTRFSSMGYLCMLNCFSYTCTHACIYTASQLWFVYNCVQSYIYL